MRCVLVEQFQQTISVVWRLSNEKVFFVEKQNRETISLISTS